MVLVTLFTRRNCHLCELARNAIAEAGARGLFELEEVDIDADPEVRARYTNDVPVVAVDGVETFWHHVDPVLFRREVENAASRRRA